MSDKSEISSYLDPTSILVWHCVQLFRASSELTFEHLILWLNNVPAMQCAASSAVWTLTHIHTVYAFLV